MVYLLGINTVNHLKGTRFEGVEPPRTLPMDPSIRTVTTIVTRLPHIGRVYGVCQDITPIRQVILSQQNSTQLLSINRLPLKLKYLRSGVDPLDPLEPPVQTPGRLMAPTNTTQKKHQFSYSHNDICSW